MRAPELFQNSVVRARAMCGRPTDRHVRHFAFVLASQHLRRAVRAPMVAPAAICGGRIRRGCIEDDRFGAAAELGELQ
jgi:hypothetical protein